ncbi:MAG: 50S ribosomal protein L13 [Flavobacteriales bacterium]|nr:50S ribosomal protein L13 [Flavobacteriales bacterium]
MDTLSYKTVSATKENSGKKWLVVDAEGQGLGRVSSRIAFLLRGKHKPNFTPHADCGDNVIVLNSEKITLSGNKMDSKEYIRHTGYPGGQRSTSVKNMLAEHPERVIEKAVKGMLPKNKLGSELFRNLKVVVGTEHGFDAQKPEKFDINSIK